MTSAHTKVCFLLSHVSFTWAPQNFMGGAVAQSVEHATPVEEVADSIPSVATCSLLVGSVSV